MRKLVPTYQYACTECGHQFEIVQAFSDDALTHCPECDGRLRKVFNAVGVVFKGSGFYRNDSRSSGTSSSSSGEASGSSGSGESSGSSTTKTDSGSTGSTGSTGSSGSSGSSSASSPSSSSTSD